MLTWLLSIAGLGGIGAALAFIPGAGPLALGWGSKVLGIVRDNPWQAALIAALLWGAYERRDSIHTRALTVQWRDAYNGQVAARRIDQQSIADLKADIARQNTAVIGMANAAQAKQEVARQELQRAKAAEAGAEAQAARIDAHAASASKSGCATSGAVIAARGSL